MLLVLIASLACERLVAPEEVRERLSALTPNLVLVVVDTLRADWTSPYGSAEDTTPELSDWAARGILFENVRSQSSWTKISVASLLTSLWPRSHGIREARDGLSDAAVTLAEVLRDAGYATYAVQTNGWLHPSFGMHQGFDRYSFPHGGSGAVKKPSVWAHADRVYEETVRLVEAHDPQQPFFLYLHYMDVHQYAAPPEYHRYGTDSKGAYRAAIRWVDDALLRVRRLLDHRGLLDRSILVLASDHGETFGEHGVNGHARNVLTPVVSVPLVVRLPFPIAPIRVTAQVRNLDLAPTLLALAGLPPAPSFEGRSLLPMALGEVLGEDAESYATLGQPLFPDAHVQHAVTDGAWTYARNLEPEAMPRELLFDRGVDPGENVNLISMEPEAAERMRTRLDAHLEKGDLGLRKRGVRIDPGIAERLRALGYLGDESH
jgi:arylsulfatase A-like enzyme